MQISSQTLFPEEIFDKIRFNEKLNKALHNYNRAKKEAFLEIDLCSYVNDKLENLKVTLSEESRTAKLWILYISYLDVLKRFFIAKRTSNWGLPVDSTLRMKNLFAPSDHINYARSAKIHIQQMQILAEMYPWVYEKCVAGFHAVRRSNCHWIGLTSSLKNIDAIHENTC